MSEPYEFEVCVEVVCDLCGDDAPNPRSRSKHVFSGAWEIASFEVNRVAICRELGENYPEGNFTKTESFDVCPDCWENKLTPWFQSQGATITVTENDD